MAIVQLSDYAAKRRFTATPEPGPQVQPRPGGPLLFVVQMHAATRLHYDFRLECDGVLKSWAVPKGPSLDPQDKRLAVPTEDHPFAYASFEGVIPKGQYGAGEVIVWDCGIYSPDEGGTDYDDVDAAQERVREGLARGKLSFQLRGEKLKGSFALVRTGRDPRSWLLLKHRDRYAGRDDVAAQHRSVLCGAAVDELKVVPAPRLDARVLVPRGPVAPLPRRLRPMLATIGSGVRRHADWSWEPKLDGYRVLAEIDGGRACLRSRNGLDLTATFPELAEALREQAGAAMLLDGEIVAFDAQGQPSFNALQNRAGLRGAREVAGARQQIPVVFFAFDLLHFAGVDLRAAPYRDRRRYLAQCLLPTPQLQLVHATDDGVALHEAALASGFEGVIGKRKDSRYESGKRSGAWIKVKPVQTAEFVIGGYTRGRGARAPLGALLLGEWVSPRKLRYVSHVGSGFDAATLAALQPRLEALRRERSPFAQQPAVNGAVTWTRPQLVAEVAFQSRTEDGALRAPVFRRLREDVDPRAAGAPAPADAAPARQAARKRRAAPQAAAASAPKAAGADPLIEGVLAQLADRRNGFTLEIGDAQVRLTHLDRVYWPANDALQQPALTKRDLLRYLVQVAPRMLPHLADRPLTMIRMPDGITGPRFFQKHWTQSRPDFVETVRVYSGSKEEQQDYLLCNNLPTLLWLGQSGTLEFHVWHSRARRGDDAITDSLDFASSLAAMEASLLNYPDYVVFDLDPYIYSGREKKGDEPELNTTAFEKGKEVAFWLRELLAEMTLEGYVKTSGKTGLHIFVPIRRTIDFDAARQISELVGRHLLRQHPKDITLEWSVPKRTGKIFMDYNMNVRGKTLNVAYSPRGAPGAPVSMPLTWQELEKAHPLDFRLWNAAERLAGQPDRWQDALTRKQSLEGVLRSAD